MEPATSDAFERSAKCLERLAQLKEKNLLEDVEYQELRSLLLAEMKRFATPFEQIIPEQVSAREPLEIYFLPYGHLHAQIVQKITLTYKSDGATPKQRVFSAMAEMAEKQALYPGDSMMLTELVEIIFANLGGVLDSSSNGADRQLLDMLRSVNEISARIRNAQETSPAAKAIADTAQQSTTRAAEEFKVERTKPEAKTTQLSSFWRKLCIARCRGRVPGRLSSGDNIPSIRGSFPGNAGDRRDIWGSGRCRSKISHCPR